MFDWREYLELATDLGQTGPGRSVTIQVSEASDRCAISRAYYAAFCHARNYASASLGFAPTHKGADHWLLQQHFVNLGMNDIARRLRQLHGWRKQSDYDDVVPNLKAKVRDALRVSTAIIQRL